MRKILVTLLVFMGISQLVYSQKDNYVSVNKAQFNLGGKPYYYIGTNYWYGGLLALQKDPLHGKQRLTKELDFLHSKGVDNLRIVVGAEGTGLVNGVERIAPPLQITQGKFDASILGSLDYLLAEMGKRNMKAILYLSNNWEWSGGFLQYLNWNGLIPDTVFRRKLNWDEQRDYTSKFYSCDKCTEAYLKQANYILDHFNKLSGKKYIDDPAIMAWELANEPRPMRPSSNNDYHHWISDVAAHIKSKDKNHLVTIGSEGDMGSESLQLFEDIHADKNVDYLTIHIWPKNWSWFKDTSIQKDLSRIVSNTENYINKHAAVAQKLQKPLVLEEFGLPRDNQSFDPASPTTLRNIYYNQVFAAWQSSRAKNGVIAGAGFWAFGGTARPKKGQVFWKQGDDYMGDPPMEEQGLNTVFDSDSATWEIIESYTKANPSSPIDAKATKETVALYNNLKKLLSKGIMFGHQDDLAYGVNWKYEPGRSDIKDVTNDYPAVYGFELGRLEIDKPVNLDSVPFDKMKGYIRDIYDRGGVTTISWHLNNPLTGKTAWDPQPGTVASILPGGEKNELYKSWLDKIALFMLDLKGRNGEYIPVIFRPFHELNGDWFWWGKSHCTPGELKQLWNFTVSYLRDVKNVHNLLYAFNTDKFYSKEEYMERYPGNDWVDVIGFDYYQRDKGDKANEQFVLDIGKMLSTLEDIAADANKIPALTEFGFGTLPDSTWWTSTFLRAIKPHRISYVLAWRNAGYKGNNNYEYYVPFKGQASAPDFRFFYDDEKTLFQKDITKENLYK
jgi:mannan endo-1,4-beta-mannosidase